MPGGQMGAEGPISDAVTKAMVSHFAREFTKGALFAPASVPAAPGADAPLVRRAELGELHRAAPSRWLFWFVCGVGFGLATAAALRSAWQAARCRGRMATWAFMPYIRGGPRQVCHQRLGLGQVALSVASLFVIGTPDLHGHAEVYSAGSAVVAAVRWATSLSVLPDGLPPGDVYRFWVGPTVVQRAAFFAAAVPEGVVAVGAADGRGADDWVADECFDGFRDADDVAHQAGAGAIGDKDIHRLAGGSGLFGQFLRPSDVQEFFTRIVAVDARFVPVRRNGLGRRGRTWADMFAAATKEDFDKDWSLSGDRAAEWSLEHINSEGNGLGVHHDRIRSLCRLVPNAWETAELLHLAAADEAGILGVQLDGTNLVIVKMLLKRMQTIEVAHLEWAKEAASELLNVVLVGVEREAQLSTALRKGCKVTPAEALRKFRVASWYDVDSAVLGSYNLASVSLPSGSPALVPLEDLWGVGGSDMIGDFVQSRLLPSSEVETRLNNSQVAVPYSDPKLRRVAAFEEFTRALQQRGMVDFSFSAKERVEAFFVHEKNGKLRLVVDCRRSNCHFQDPAPVSLLAGEGLAGLELGEGEGLSLFWSCYAFVRKNCTQEERLWASVRRELSLWDGLAPLLWRDLRAGWSDEVVAVDASEWGLGACAAQCGGSLARSVGRTSERWRWGRVGAAMGPRRHALDHARKAEAAAALAGEAREAAPWIAAANDVPGPECAPPQPPSAGSGVLDSPGDVFGFGRVKRVVDFPEVPREMIELRWSVVGRFPWRRKGESIAVYEARATLYGFRHLLRSSRNLGKHVVVLGDSQSTARAVTRFRSDSRSMMRVTQAIAALSLATGSALHYRWLPSEWNVADSPSRGLWAPAAPSPLDFSKHAPAGQTRADLDRRSDGAAGGACGLAGLAAGQTGGHPRGHDGEPLYVSTGPR
ncbi:unnamed protein product, partial [Prorocentrum cordatum]